MFSIFENAVQCSEMQYKRIAAQANCSTSEMQYKSIKYTQFSGSSVNQTMGGGLLHKSLNSFTQMHFPLTHSLKTHSGEDSLSKRLTEDSLTSKLCLDVGLCLDVDPLLSKYFSIVFPH